MKKLSPIPLAVLLVLSVLAIFVGKLPGDLTAANEGLSSGDTAWMLTSTALVLFMTPGLAYFYGGMVNKKNVISTMLQSFISMAVISVLWVVCGFSLAFGDSIGGFIGNPSTFLFFNNVIDGKPWSLAATVPLVIFAFFQLKFAIITPALITGAFAERIRFTSYLLFITLWSILIYSPLAHWAWHPDGFLFKMGVLDFAGGTVVHISAGTAALAAVLFLKGRKFASEVHEPANIPYVVLGTGLLWFGWFGFNAGSAVSSGLLATVAFANTNTASAAAALAWVFYDAAKGKKPSALGACIGAVVGLVAITPAAGFVTIPQALLIGTTAAIISNVVANWRAKTSIDDTLDVFPCHGVGGMVGMLFTGVFATKAVNSAVADEGLFYGATTLFTNHLIALVIVVVFVFVGTFAILWIVDKIEPLRVAEEEEKVGLDISQHDEALLVHA